jgi:NAD(P)-dependent dehydrogenase (short-subunit alcohol dehydrogenase family)
MNTAVITGAGSGIGAAVAFRFVSEGWSVALVGRRDEALARTEALAGRNADDRVARFPCDVTDPAAVTAMGAAVLERFGAVDALVNAAGINIPQRSFEALSIEDWQAVIATNLHGAYYCVRTFLPGMRERGAGSIVNINSDVGKVARVVAGPAYVASKFGLRGLTQQINVEERANGIRACSIMPRDVNTPLLDRRLQPPSPELRARMIQPEDIAACVWLVATMQPYAIVEEILLSTR